MSGLSLCLHVSLIRGCLHSVTFPATLCASCQEAKQNTTGRISNWRTFALTDVKEHIGVEKEAVAQPHGYSLTVLGKNKMALTWVLLRQKKHTEHNFLTLNS